MDFTAYTASSNGVYLMGPEALLSRSMVFYIKTWSAVYFFPQNLPDEAILDYRPEPAAPFVSHKAKCLTIQNAHIDRTWLGVSQDSLHEPKRECGVA